MSKRSAEPSIEVAACILVALAVPLIATSMADKPLTPLSFILVTASLFATGLLFAACFPRLISACFPRLNAQVRSWKATIVLLPFFLVVMLCAVIWMELTLMPHGLSGDVASLVGGYLAFKPLRQAYQSKRHSKL